MFTKKMLSAALVSGGLLAVGTAGAQTMVTLNPMAANGGAGQVSNVSGPFQAVGLQANLFSTLTINGTSGNASFIETGTIETTPEALHAWLGELGGACGHRPVALAVEAGRKLAS